MRGTQTTRIALFLVLIATGVVIGHLLAIDNDAPRPQAGLFRESHPARSRVVQASFVEDAPGVVSLSSLEDDYGVPLSGCPFGACRSVCSADSCRIGIDIVSDDCEAECADVVPELVSANGWVESNGCRCCKAKPCGAESSSGEDCDVETACTETSESKCNSQCLGACNNSAETCVGVSKCCESAQKCQAAGPRANGSKRDPALENALGETEAVPTPPEALRAPDNAEPITKNRPPLTIETYELHADVPKDPELAKSRKEAALRKIIEQELPNSREDEREIWFEELKGLHPEMVRELLRLRGDFNRSDVETHDPLPEVIAPPPPLIAKEDSPSPFPPALGIESAKESAYVFDAVEIAQRLQPSRAALAQAARVILNNIANANTAGFKRSSAVLSDLEYEVHQLPGAPDAGGHFAAAGISIGLGVQISGMQIDHSGGLLRHTGGALDLAISGEGFFQLRDPSGKVVYTRAGRFARNADGALVLAGSTVPRLLEPAITIPTDAAEVSISADGVVSVTEPPNSAPTPLGQLQTVRFINPQGMSPMGDNIFAATDASGAPQVGAPGLEGRGKLKQRYLEGSNVSLTTELAALREIQSQLQALEQAAAILSPGLAAPHLEMGPTIPSIPDLDEPSQQGPPGGRFTGRVPQQTSEHIPPDRAKR